MSTGTALSPVAATLGFAAPPAKFYLLLVALVVAYLGLVEIVKKRFVTPPQPAIGRRRAQDHRIHRRAAGFTSGTRAEPPSGGSERAGAA